jgi:hypothetical protein
MTYTGQHGQEITPAAYHALFAARLAKTCGRWAARRYAEKRGVAMGLYRLARQLTAMAQDGG